MQGALIKEFGREHFEKGFYGFAPSLVELFLDYLNILNKDLDKNYQKEWDNYLRICLAGTENADKHKPIKPNYYDIDTEILTEFLASYDLDFEWVNFNSLKDFDF